MSSLYQRSGEVFLAALARPAEERDAFVVSACGADEELLREVQSLLLFHTEGEAGADSAPADEHTFAAGELFAGRYRMIARVGRGGMGDVWRADDLVLDTEVALKLMRLVSPADRTRSLQEVRLSRQITHPAVCRVFDVGEVGNTIYFSMEFVRGEDLAALLKRTGRLTSERVAEIGHQLCAGMAAAHAQGVLHRDLKPANILIDEHGQVRVTDFGIAVTLDDPGRHAMFGTPGYMAPEQMAGAPVSQRTDVHAIGLVLYELVTGASYQLVRRSTATHPRMSELAPGISPQLERAIMQALADDPADRPATASALAAALPDVGDARGAGQHARLARRSRIAWRLAASAAILVSVAAGAAALLATRRAAPLTARDTVVLADFDNRTDDPVFDGTLKVALAVALEQSPFLRVFPNERVREDLVLMRRPVDGSVTAPIAREVAEREQFRAFIASSIASVGRNYVVTLEAINVATGDVMARQHFEVASKEEVLTALSGAASKLRTALGESLPSLQRYDVPLPRATTPSLDALHSYALALDEGRIRPTLEAIPHLKRAIELDPHFALALALLSGTYANTGQTELAPEFARKAYELRDRVTERERYFIAWRYHRDATLAWDDALELARAWTAAYPRESFAFNSLGLAAHRLGRYEEALEPFRESIRLDPKFVAPWQNLVATTTALNQFDRARSVVAEARKAGIDYVGLHRVTFLLAFISNDQAAMAQELDATRADAQAPWASNWQPRVSAFAGHVKASHDEYVRSVMMTSQAHQVELAGQYSAEHAELHAVVRQCPDARREAAAALRFSRDEITLATAARALALCGAAADAEAASAELSRRFPQAVLATNVLVPVIAAAGALAADAPARALELLETTRRFDHAPIAEFWPAYLRGQAHLELSHYPDAASEFRNITDHRGERADSLLYPLAYLGLGRALAKSGDVAAAREAYVGFFEWWKSADADLLPLTAARLEFDRLPQR